MVATAGVRNLSAASTEVEFAFELASMCDAVVADVHGKEPAGVLVGAASDAFGAAWPDVAEIALTGPRDTVVAADSCAGDSARDAPRRSSISWRSRETPLDSSSERPGASPSQKGIVGGWP